MKKVLFSIVLSLFLSSQSFAFYVYENEWSIIRTCFPPNAYTEYDRFSNKESFMDCQEELKQAEKELRFYKRQYEKCEDKNKYQDWCQEYKRQYDEYRSILKDPAAL